MIPRIKCSFAIAFNASPEQAAEISRYEFYGSDDLGVRVAYNEFRIAISIYCMLDSTALYEMMTVPGRHSRRQVDDSISVLFNLLTDIRKQLIAGDYRALYAVWVEYGLESDEEEEAEVIPPEPPAREEGQEVVEWLRGLLACRESHVYWQPVDYW